MPIVEVWLGLLLGNFSLKQQETFYDSQNIWIYNNYGMQGYFILDEVDNPIS